MFLCPHCEKECKSNKSLIAHVAVCQKNPNGKKHWALGKTKETDVRLMNLSKAKQGVSRPDFVPWWKGLKGDPRLTGQAHSPEKEALRRKKLSDHAKANGYGGRKNGTGRGKKGKYKGFSCDSSWELAFLIYHLDHGIDIARCDEVRTYEWEGKTRRYYPDFVVGSKVIEIKGYKSPQCEEKLKSNPDVICLMYNDLKEYLSYVIEKYGPDYVKLYEEGAGVGSPTALERQSDHTG